MSAAPSSPRRTRLSPLAVALVAVAIIFSSTGGAVAGALITGKQIKNGSVTGVDIKDGSLAGRDIKDGSITAADTLDEPVVIAARVNTQIDDFTAGNYTTLVSRTFVSRAGFLSVSASFYAEDDVTLGGLGNLGYRVRVDGKVADPGTLTRLQYSAEEAGATGYTAVTVPVAAGTHTIVLEALELGTGSYIFGRQIQALYTPAGSVTGPAPVVPLKAPAARQAVR